MRKPKRQRFQAGLRRKHSVEPAAAPALAVHCPICLAGVPAGRLGDIRGPDGHAILFPRVSWVPQLPFPISLKLRWPRKPDGGRGFFWEKLELHRVNEFFPDAIRQLQRAVTYRMLAWLSLHGVDSAHRPLKIHPADFGYR